MAYAGVFDRTVREFAYLYTVAYFELLAGVFVGFGKYTSEIGHASGACKGGVALVVAQSYLCAMLLPVAVVSDGDGVAGAAFGHGFLQLRRGECGVFG